MPLTHFVGSLAASSKATYRRGAFWSPDSTLTVSQVKYSHKRMISGFSAHQPDGDLY